MITLYKNYHLKLFNFLLLLICILGVPLELRGAYGPTYLSGKNFELEQKIDLLLLLIQKRLSIMHEVARTKWNQNLPIEDKDREEQILTNLANKSKAFGLDEKFVIKFFQAQIDASKRVQRDDFFLWNEQNVHKFEKILSLKGELRDYIDHLNHEMIMVLSQIYSWPCHDISSYILEQPISKRSSDHIANDVWSIAILPLKMALSP